MPPESASPGEVRRDVIPPAVVVPTPIVGAPRSRPLIALTPSLRDGVRRVGGGGPRDRRAPSSTATWICTNLLDALDQG